MNTSDQYNLSGEQAYVYLTGDCNLPIYKAISLIETAEGFEEVRVSFEGKVLAVSFIDGYYNVTFHALTKRSTAE